MWQKHPGQIRITPKPKIKNKSAQATTNVERIPCFWVEIGVASYDALPGRWLSSKKSLNMSQKSPVGEYYHFIASKD